MLQSAEPSYASSLSGDAQEVLSASEVPYGTLDSVEKPLLSLQHLSNGKSSNRWHNYEASFLLSLTMGLLMSQERALS